MLYMVWNDGIICIVDIELENVTNVSHKTDEGVFLTLLSVIVQV